MSQLAQIQALIKHLDLTEIETMNQLKDHGIVSDCAVWLKDCSDSDLRRAIRWMNDFHNTQTK